jgi:hypothetical protein
MRTCAQTKRRKQQDRNGVHADQDRAGDSNAINTPNATGGRANSSTKCDNQTKNTASGQTQKLIETQGFCLWEVVLTLAGILVCSWEVVLAEWLSPVIWKLGKKKIMSPVEVLVPTQKHKLCQTLTKSTILGDQIWVQIWPNF